MPGYYGRVYPVERVSGGQAAGTTMYVAAAVAPHAPTVRFTYTVPSGSAAEIEGVTAVVVQDAAGAAAAQSFVTIYLGSGAHLVLLYDYAFALGAVREAFLTRLGFIRAGESVSAQTFDGKGAGTRTYTLNVRYHEFLI